MKTLLIINPYSRSGKSGALAQKAMTYLKQKNFAFDYVIIKEFDEAYKYSVEANNSGIDNIVAVGGDGTLNKVINGFFDECGNKISGSGFGAIHTGTSPDFCKSYNIPSDPVQAADVIIGQHVKNIPVGMIKLAHTFPPAQSEVKYFVCCANIGLGAALARSAGSGIRAYLGDFLGTFISFIRILVTYKGTDYKVCINNEEAELKNIINISVGITKYIASGITVYRDEAVPDDQFYILKTGSVKIHNIPALLRILYSGKKFSNKSFLSLEYARRMEIDTSYVHPEVEFDGDPAGFLPCTIEIAKDRLPVFTNQRA